MRSTPRSLECVRELHRLRQIPSSLHPIGGRDPHEQRQLFRPHVPHRLRRTQRQPSPVLEAAAVLVGAAVDQRGEELVHEVSVGHVQLDHAESRVEGSAGGRNEPVHHRVDVDAAHRARRSVARRERLRARPDRLPTALLRRHPAAFAPRPIRRGFASRVRELDSRDRTLRGDELRDRRERLGVGVRPDPGVEGRDAPFGEDRGSLGHHQARAAHRAASEMHEMPIVDDAVGARVLAHRRDEHAVAKGDRAQRQR